MLTAVKDHLDLEARIGGYEAAAHAAVLRQRPYDAIAGYLNCDASEVAIVENATVAWNQAFFSVLDTMSAGDRILTAEAEYASNYLTYLKAARDRGVKIDVVPSTNAGELDVGALENMIDARAKLISVTHIPTNGGLVNPAAAIGKVARSAGVPYLLDACQSVGQRALDVQEIGCDFLTATGRKYLRGRAAPDSSMPARQRWSAFLRRSSTCTRPGGTGRTASRGQMAQRGTKTGSFTRPAESGSASRSM